MKARSNMEVNVRPHPCPLPQERENRSRSLEISSDWICRVAIRKTLNGHLLFPLLGGVGLGEGEVNH
jgi:hypothetical protein